MKDTPESKERPVEATPVRKQGLLCLVSSFVLRALIPPTVPSFKMDIKAGISPTSLRRQEKSLRCPLFKTNSSPASGIIYLRMVSLLFAP